MVPAINGVWKESELELEVAHKKIFIMVKFQLQLDGRFSEKFVFQNNSQKQNYSEGMGGLEDKFNVVKIVRTF